MSKSYYESQKAILDRMIEKDGLSTQEGSLNYNLHAPFSYEVESIKSDMDEIICWNMIFYNCLTNKDYETFITWCIIRYWDEKYKFINIHKMNGFCSKNERIPKDVKKYIDYCKYEKDLDILLDIEAEKLYINITQIPYVFNIIFFMKKLEKEAKVNDDYKDFDIINYETMIKEIKEMKKTKKTLKTIQEMEIVDYDLDILF